MSEMVTESKVSLRELEKVSQVSVEDEEGSADIPGVEVGDNELVQLGLPTPLPDSMSLPAPTTHSWKQLFTRLLTSSLLVVALVTSFMWLYIGTSWDVDTTQIKFGVVIAPQLNYSTLGLPATIFGALPAPTQLLNTTFIQPFVSFTTGRFGYEILSDVMDRTGAVAEADDGGRVWSVIYLPETFARSLVAGLVGLNNSQPAIFEYIHDSGKHVTSDKSFYQAVLTFYRSYRSSVGQSLVSLSTRLSGGTPPFVTVFWVGGPVQIVNTDIHPVNRDAQNLHSFILFVVLFVGVILTVTSTSLIHDPRNATRQGVWRLVVAVAIIMLESLMVSLVPWCLDGAQGSFSEVWAWWFFVAITLLSFVAALYVYLGRMVGQALATLFLYLMLASSSGIVASTISPPFFKIGIIFPSYYAVHGARALYFGSQRHLLTRDALVILAWFVGCSILAGVGYLRGANVKYGRRVYERTRAKIVVPPKRGKAVGSEGLA